MPKVKVNVRISSLPEHARPELIQQLQACGLSSIQTADSSYSLLQGTIDASQEACLHRVAGVRSVTRLHESVAQA